MNGQIKELTNLQDFKRVYKVFSGPPYNEKYTEEELGEIFKEYQEKGYIYGAYNNEECEILVDFRTINKEVEKLINSKIETLKEKYEANVQELNKLSAFFNQSELSTKTCNFITEASFIRNNCMILGAGPITAHETNEYITINSLYKLVEQYKKLIEKFCK